MFELIPQDWRKKIGSHLGAPNLGWSLMQLRRYGFSPENIMDVGAFRGDWTKICLEVFPKANITCIEPQEKPQADLRKLARQRPNLKVIQILLGSQVKASIPFQERGSGSSVLLPAYENESGKPITTIDQLILEGRLDPPELLKLDVQGYEMEVLKGWGNGFEKCQVIQCEVSLLPLVKGSPLLPEIIVYLQNQDFVMFDITELIRSPSDEAVWQIDALFCRKDSPLRANRVW